MKHTYNITGMTCNSCVANVKTQLLMLADITGAHVQLTAPQATITMQKHLPVETLQAALRNAGNYKITEADGGMRHTVPGGEKKSWFETYKPIVILFAYITGITFLIEVANGSFVWMRWMQNFMAAFFLAFSFFKMLDIKGFAGNYFSYDIIAKRWMGWGYVYAFIEVALGLAFLLRFNPVITNVVTFAVMSVSIVGVLQSVLNKRQIKCACLGAVFNVPMSTVTIFEDALMIAMSAGMLISILY